MVADNWISEHNGQESGFRDQTARSWMVALLSSGTHYFTWMSVFLIREMGITTATYFVELVWGWNKWKDTEMRKIILTRSNCSAVTTVTKPWIWPAGFQSVTSDVGRNDVRRKKHGQEQLLEGWPHELKFGFPTCWRLNDLGFLRPQFSCLTNMEDKPPAS